MSRLAGVAAAVTAAVALLELMMAPGQGLPGGYAVFAVVGAGAIVGVAKTLAALGLQRPAPPDESDE